MRPSRHSSSNPFLFLDDAANLELYTLPRHCAPLIFLEIVLNLSRPSRLSPSKSFEILEIALHLSRPSRLSPSKSFEIRRPLVVYLDPSKRRGEGLPSPPP